MVTTFIAGWASFACDGRLSVTSIVTSRIIRGQVIRVMAAPPIISARLGETYGGVLRVEVEREGKSGGRAASSLPGRESATPVFVASYRPYGTAELQVASAIGAGARGGPGTRPESAPA